MQLLSPAVQPLGRVLNSQEVRSHTGSMVEDMQRLFGLYISHVFLDNPPTLSLFLSIAKQVTLADTPNTHCATLSREVGEST